jgi:hypothetical protein
MTPTTTQTQASPEAAPPATVDRGPVSPLPRWVFLLLALVYLYTFPYFDRVRSANETPRILMTQELVDRGVFHLDRRIGDMDSTLDLSRGPDGRLYPNKAPGPSFLAIPAYLVLKALGATSLRACTWAFRATAVTVPALLFLPLFYRLTQRFAPDEPARRTALAAYALASPALLYGILFFSHTVAAVCLGSSFAAAVALVRDEPRRWHNGALAAGFFGGMAVMMDYQAAMASALIGGYVLVRGRGRVHNLLRLAAGALPPATVLGIYHFVCFGSPFKTGYSFSIDTALRNGFMGTVGPNAESAFITFLMPSRGILVLMPWVLLALVGAIAIWRDPEARKRVGAEAVLALSVVVVYALFVSSLVPYMARGGWSVGPRYFTVCLPFVGWLAAAGCAVADRRRLTSIAAQALVVTGGVIHLVAVTTYPHWPEALQNPLHELSFRLLSGGYAVHSLGTVVGLRGLAAAAPLFLLSLALLFWLLANGQRRSWRTTIVACALAGMIVAGERAFPPTIPSVQRTWWAFVTGTWEPELMPRD